MQEVQACLPPLCTNKYVPNCPQISLFRIDLLEVYCAAPTRHCQDVSCPLLFFLAALCYVNNDLSAKRRDVHVEMWVRRCMTVMCEAGDGSEDCFFKQM